jgi:hypothetical protein
MKTCPKCGSTENGFYRNRANRDGLSSQCKRCQSADIIARAKREPDKANKRHREWYAKNPDKGKGYAKKFYDAHPQTDLQKSQAIARSKLWAMKNPERRRIIANNWVKNNLPQALAACRKRQIHKFQATPVWVDSKEIRKFYVEAARKTRETGIRYSVDHVIPLRGKTSCGLHVPWNLQVIPLSENVRKSNKVDTFIRQTNI